MVLTRSAALRYFGQDRPIGAHLERVFGADVLRLRVTAVIEDLPVATHLDREVIASARTAGSDLAIMDANPNPGIGGGLNYTYVRYTYVRARPGVDAEALQPALDDIVRPFQAMVAASGTSIAFGLNPSPPSISALVIPICRAQSPPLRLPRSSPSAWSAC